MCSTPRPSTIDAIGASEQRQPQEWDADGLGRGETAAAAERVGEGGGGVGGPPGSSGIASAASWGGGRLTSTAAAAATPRMESSISGSEVYAGGVSGVAEGRGSGDADGAVDGILGGLSPGGGAFPAAAATGVAPTVPCVAAGKGAGAGRSGTGGLENTGIDWEQGEEWEGVGNASFGGDSPVHTAFGFPLGGVHGDSADATGDGGGAWQRRKSTLKK